MKIVAISDTHGKHRQVSLPAGDILVHAGDVCMKGSQTDVFDFLDWFKQQPFAHKIFIAGNHDFFFEQTSREQVAQHIPDGVIYLNDSGITIDGIKFWGSPVTPWFFDWAFNRRRGEEINRHWELMTPDAEVVITHGPVFRTLDKTPDGQSVGCKDLFKKIMEVKPRAHICGHIHSAYGAVDKSGTKFVNASLVDEAYELKNSPIMFEI